MIGDSTQEEGTNVPSTKVPSKPGPRVSSVAASDVPVELGSHASKPKAVDQEDDGGGDDQMDVAGDVGDETWQKACANKHAPAAAATASAACGVTTSRGSNVVSSATYESVSKVCSRSAAAPAAVLPQPNVALTEPKKTSKNNANSGRGSRAKPIGLKSFFKSVGLSRSTPSRHATSVADASSSVTAADTGDADMVVKDMDVDNHKKNDVLAPLNGKSGTSSPTSDTTTKKPRAWSSPLPTLGSLAKSFKKLASPSSEERRQGGKRMKDEEDELRGREMGNDMEVEGGQVVMGAQRLLIHCPWLVTWAKEAMQSIAHDRLDALFEESRDAALEQAEAVADERGVRFRLVTVPGAGHCLYSSMQASLHGTWHAQGDVGLRHAINIHGRNMDPHIRIDEMNMTLGQLVALTALGDGRLVGWSEFWNTHANSNEWATHAQIVAASSYYQRPLVVVTSLGAQTVTTPGVVSTTTPLYVMLTMASVTVPGQAEPLAAHHYEGLYMVEKSEDETEEEEVDEEDGDETEDEEADDEEEEEDEESSGLGEESGGAGIAGNAWLLVDGVTRDELINRCRARCGDAVADKLATTLAKQCLLSASEVAEVQDIHAAVGMDLPPARGLPSRIEGLEAGRRVEYLDLHGFPLERQDVDGDAMFPPRVATGKVYRLDRAGREEGSRMDVVAAPGVTQQGNGRPDWPPEKQRCMQDSIRAVQYLVERGLGVVRANGAEASAVARDALRPLTDSHSIDLDLHADVTTRLYDTSDHGPVLVLENQHLCRGEMHVVSHGERRRAARGIDATSAALDVVLADGRAFAIQQRVLTRTDSLLSPGGAADLEAKRDAMAWRCFRCAYADLDQEHAAILDAAFEGALDYPKTPRAWAEQAGTLMIVFADTPSIVAVLQGGYQKKKAGKNIRQSDRGTTGANQMVVGRDGKKVKRASMKANTIMPSGERACVEGGEESIKAKKKMPVTKPGFANRHQQDTYAGGSADYTAKENEARGKGERSTRQGKSDGGKTGGAAYYVHSGNRTLTNTVCDVATVTCNDGLSVTGRLKPARAQSRSLVVLPPGGNGLKQTVSEASREAFWRDYPGGWESRGTYCLREWPVPDEVSDEEAEVDQTKEV